MGRNTHSAFIQFDGSRAFVDGLKDKCQHDYSEVVYMLSNDEYLKEKDYRCPTNEATQEYIQHVAEQKNAYIQGCTTACSRCGKIYTMSDIIWDSF